MTATIQIVLFLLAVLVLVAVVAQRPENRAVDPAGGRGHCAGAGSRPAAGRARAGIGAAGAAAAADLFGRRVDELARIPLQPAPDHAAGLRLRGVHHLRGRRRHALSARLAMGRRLRARRHRRAAGRGGAARHCAAAGAAAAAPRGAGGRRPRQRRHRADPLPLRRAGDLDRRVLADEGRRHLRPDRARRDLLRHRRRLAEPAAAAMGAQPARRDHAVADDALSRLLDSRASRRLRRARDRRRRALRELERPAAHPGGDAAAGHLLLGPDHLSDRGLRLSDHRPAGAHPDREGARLPGPGIAGRDRYHRRDRDRRALRLDVSRRPICRAG